jgi:hypothetical protein
MSATKTSKGRPPSKGAMALGKAVVRSTARKSGLPGSFDLAELRPSDGHGFADQFQHRGDRVFIALGAQKLGRALGHRVEQGVVFAQRLFGHFAIVQFGLELGVGDAQFLRAVLDGLGQLGLEGRKLLDAIVFQRRVRFGFVAPPYGAPQKLRQDQECERRGRENRPFPPGAPAPLGEDVGHRHGGVHGEVAAALLDEDIGAERAVGRLAVDDASAGFDPDARRGIFDERAPDRGGALCGRLVGRRRRGLRRQRAVIGERADRGIEAGSGFFENRAAFARHEDARDDPNGNQGQDDRQEDQPVEPSYGRGLSFDHFRSWRPDACHAARPALRERCEMDAGARSLSEINRERKATPGVSFALHTDRLGIVTAARPSSRRRYERASASRSFVRCARSRVSFLRAQIRWRASVAPSTAPVAVLHATRRRHLICHGSRPLTPPAGSLEMNSGPRPTLNMSEGN